MPLYPLCRIEQMFQTRDISGRFIHSIKSLLIFLAQTGCDGSFVRFGIEDVNFT